MSVAKVCLQFKNTCIWRYMGKVAGVTLTTKVLSKHADLNVGYTQGL